MSYSTRFDKIRKVFSKAATDADTLIEDMQGEADNLKYEIRRLEDRELEIRFEKTKVEKFRDNVLSIIN